jgi:hypothetical protein
MRRLDVLDKTLDRCKEVGGLDVPVMYAVFGLLMIGLWEFWCVNG